ncbi:rhomboid family protein [Corynebacterium pseudotuberculosis]|nr:Rhomboid family protein [Corynebacterium pseudotuberculosis]RKT28826.1 membrane associated rhomboid family serine protease [Corynebacterium pseudotuberculosis]VTQ80803.1 rhomboid family protein [Corynebacterium pseudotuberculosis]
MARVLGVFCMFHENGGMSDPRILHAAYKQAPVTVLLSLSTLIIFLITAFQSQSITDNLYDSWIGTHWILYTPEMHEPLGMLRAIGSMFLHIGPGHLAINIFLLFFLGREIEQCIGSALFCAAYFISGLGASLMIMIMDPLSPTAGASGAIYGLMAIMVAIAVTRKTDIRAPLILVAVNVGYSLIADNVSLWGHIGGLVAGSVVALPLMAFHRKHVIAGGTGGFLVYGMPRNHRAFTKDRLITWFVVAAIVVCEAIGIWIVGMKLL